MSTICRAIASAAGALVVALPFVAFAGPGYLNAGTMVTSKINQTIDSGSARSGDKFTMTIVAPYPNTKSVYANAQLYGHITRVVGAGQGQNPVLEFAFDRIVLADGRAANVKMTLQTQETQRHNNIGNIALTAAAGMIVGNMVGKTIFKSNLGGAAGLIAGALYANNKRTNVSLRQGSVVVMEMQQTVALNRPSMTALAH
jgi:hypothetical protein